MPDKKYVHYLVVTLSATLYYYLFYHLTRTDSYILVGTYSLLFIGYLILIRHKFQFDIRWLLAISLLFRVIPLFALLSLSDDVYRFIWDGRLWASGINPFAGLPTEFIGKTELVVYGINNELFELLNSPGHYTIYPPVPQYIHLMAAKLFANNIFYSVIFIRVAIIIAEIVSIYLIYLLLRRFKLKLHFVAIYAFNPLVIIELAGNLHHEAFMIVFLLGFLLYFSNSTTASAFMLALSVSSKLLPLMFLPFILLREKSKAKFIIIFAATTLLLFAPLLDSSFWHGMQDSLTLYYQTLEFNAGFYYLLREIGFGIYGYNAIAIIGKLLLITSTGMILWLTFRLYIRGASTSATFTFIYLVFAFFSLILHPWYIVLFIALAPFTRFKFPLVWSYLVFLTYMGYQQGGFYENYYIVGAEFITLLVVVIYDLYNYARSSLNLKEAP